MIPYSMLVRLMRIYAPGDRVVAVVSLTYASVRTADGRPLEVAAGALGTVSEPSTGTVVRVKWDGLAVIMTTSTGSIEPAPVEAP